MIRKENPYKRKNNSEEESEEETTIHIGSRYMVKRKDNEWARAEVIQTRFNKQGRYTEYYVHYDSLNRRLDEWVPAKRIMISQSESSDEVDSFEGRRSSESSEDSPLSSINYKANSGDTLSSVDEELTSENAAPNKTDDVEKEHEEITKVKYINSIQFGIYEIDTWYFSPYPDEFGEQEKLFICEFCLKYMSIEKAYRYHMSQCTMRAPPGTEIYRKGTLAIYEVDPVKSRLYCQNLCLFAKLFIDHKTVFYDVEPFLFYVLCEVDKQGSHLRGYFSKEKESPDGHNVACILTLPPFQRQGYGKLLIAFSYELSKIEGTVGSPEKPLSDLGRLSYKSYWSWVLLDILKDFRGTVAISSLSQMTSITETDITSTLESMSMLKYWSGTDTLCVTPDLIASHILSAQFKRPRLTVDPGAITWTPSSRPRKSPSIQNDGLTPVFCPWEEYLATRLLLR